MPHFLWFQTTPRPTFHYPSSSPSPFAISHFHSSCCFQTWIPISMKMDFFLLCFWFLSVSPFPWRRRTFGGRVWWEWRTPPTPWSLRLMPLPNTGLMRFLLGMGGLEPWFGAVSTLRFFSSMVCPPFNSWRLFRFVWTNLQDTKMYLDGICSLVTEKSDGCVCVCVCVCDVIAFIWVFSVSLFRSL